MIDGSIAFAMTGAPVFDPRPSYWLGVLYLALFASVLTFSLYYPVVRKIGPAKAAYSSVLVPIIAMGFSTALEHYRWTPTTIAAAAAVRCASTCRPDTTRAHASSRYTMAPRPRAPPLRTSA